MAKPTDTATPIEPTPDAPAGAETGRLMPGFYSDQGALVRCALNSEGIRADVPEILRKDGSWIRYPPFDADDARPLTLSGAQNLGDDFTGSQVDLLADRRDWTREEAALMMGAAADEPYGDETVDTATPTDPATPVEPE